MSLSERFEADGYLKIEGFVEHSACDRLQEHVIKGVESFVASGHNTRSIFSTINQEHRSDEYFLTSGDKIRYFFEEEAFDEEGNLTAEPDRAINKIGHAMHDLDPEFNLFSRTSDLAELASQLGLSEWVLLQSMLIFKQPRIGGEVSWHTDHTFLWTEPASVVGFWFALEDATLENGCLWALPGQHRLAPKSRFRRSGPGVTTEVFDETPFDDTGAVALEVPKGALIVLHGLLPHYSSANRSDHSRMAYTVHAIDPTAQYPADNWLQRRELPMRSFSG